MRNKTFLFFHIWYNFSYRIKNSSIMFFCFKLPKWLKKKKKIFFIINEILRIIKDLNIFFKIANNDIG